MRKISKKSRKEKCKICGKKSYYISQNQKCEECVTNAQKRAILGLKLREGPAYDKWKKNLLKGLEK